MGGVVRWAKLTLGLFDGFGDLAEPRALLIGWCIVWSSAARCSTGAGRSARSSGFAAAELTLTSSAERSSAAAPDLGERWRRREPLFVFLLLLTSERAEGASTGVAIAARTSDPARQFPLKTRA